ncbi:MAG: hypothetical protein J0I12_02620 [Candidatus Eremiobacteraeota bacterium]|nr:hypothetical protein [Candidatus Eremiobacteraeota bacterium]
MKTLLCFLLLTVMAAAQNGGRIKVSFIEPKSEISRAVHQAFVSDKSNGIQALMDVISQSFKLPRNMDVVFAETGKVNAWYDPEHHAVIMAYDFVEFMIKDAVANKGNEKEAIEYATGAILFTLMHEMGHALIGEMDVPVVGREEDAADEFATMILLDCGPQGHQILGSAADWFYAMGRNQKELAFWDEHSLDQQRLYNILLLMYGHSPNTYGSIVSTIVPKNRMAKALYEYKIKEHRWDKLLTPYVRGGH